MFVQWGQLMVRARWSVLAATVVFLGFGATAPIRRRRRRTVPDLVFVLLTVGLFAVLALVVRGAERL